MKTMGLDKDTKYILPKTIDITKVLNVKNNKILETSILLTFNHTMVGQFV